MLGAPSRCCGCCCGRSAGRGKRCGSSSPLATFCPSVASGEEAAMRGTEVEALGAIGGGALARFGTVARGVHRAVAGRTFGALGVLGAPVRVMHDGISS